MKARELRNLMAMLWLTVVAMAVLATMATAAEERPPVPRTAAELFRETTVWTIHLKFTPDQWAAMEPKGGGGMFGPGRGPGAGPRNPGGPGAQPPRQPDRNGPGGEAGRPGGPAFGPSMFLAPVFMKDGDQDRDGRLSREEFTALGGKWFATWDKKNAGRVTGDELRAGLNATFAPPQPAVAPVATSMFQGREGGRNGLASVMGIEFAFVHADMEFAGHAFKDVAVRYKGNGTWIQSQGSDKKSLKIDLNRFTKGQKLTGISEFNLHSCVTDASLMNEVLSYRLFRDAGVPAARTAYARVYVTVPGLHDRKYLGLYSLVENVDTAFLRDRFEGKKGVLFKPVTPSLFTDLGDDWAKYNQAYDPKSEPSKAEAQRVMEFARLVTKTDDAEFAAKAGEYLDLDAFSRFMAVTVWLSTLDSILTTGQNYYVYLHPRTDTFRLMPWDLDHSFGNFFVMGTQEQRENLSILHPWQGNNRFLERVFKLEAFRTLYLARMKEFSGTIFKPERFHQQVDEIAKAIRPAVEEESKESLERFDKVVAGQPVPPASLTGAGPGAFGMRMMPSPKPIKGFVTARAQAVLDQLEGKKQGNVMGGFGIGPQPAGPRPAESGPGRFLAPAFMAAHDGNKDGQLAREEFVEGLGKWFDSWSPEQGAPLTDEQLRAGIDKALMPRGFAPPGGPGARP